MLEKLYCLIEGDSTQLALSNGTIIMEFLKCLHIVRYFCQHLYCQHGNCQLPVPGCTRLLEPPSIREYSFSITCYMHSSESYVHLQSFDSSDTHKVY